MKRSVLGAAAAVLAALLLVGAASAHGGAEVKVEPAAAAPGDNVSVSGSGFEEGTDVAIMLEGAQGQVDLGHATVGDDGSFQLQATLPSSVDQGSYQLVAQGGDDKEEADFTVTAAAMNESSQSADAAPASDMPAGQGITYRRSTGETVTAGIILGLVAVLGAGLAFSGSRRREAQA